jgi:protein gp37
LVLNIKRECDEQRFAFFFKQWGGWGVDGKKRAKKQNGRFLQGRMWDAVPATASNTQMQSLTV